MIAFLAGLFTGVTIGVVAMCLMIAARQNETPPIERRGE